MDAVQARFPEHASPEAQAARRNIDALLRHFHETGTRRNAVPALANGVRTPLRSQACGALIGP